MRRIRRDFEDRAAGEEILPVQVADYVSDGQMQVLDGEGAALVQTNQRASFPDERIEGAYADGADTALIPRRNRALRIAR